MPRLGNATLVFDLLAAPVSPCLRRLSFPPPSSWKREMSSIATLTDRTFSTMAHFPTDLFDYTSGRWMYVSYVDMSNP